LPEKREISHFSSTCRKTKKNFWRKSHGGCRKNHFQSKLNYSLKFFCSIYSRNGSEAFKHSNINKYEYITFREVNRSDELMLFVLIEKLLHPIVNVVQTNQELGVRWFIHLAYVIIVNK
jgi:hypothetical protein